jgi:hypothetical protein
MPVSHRVSAVLDDPNLVWCAGLAPILGLAQRCGLDRPVGETGGMVKTGGSACLSRLLASFLLILFFGSFHELSVAEGGSGADRPTSWGASTQRSGFVEAGGHRGGFDDTHPGHLGLLAMLQLVNTALDDTLPLVSTGGLSTGRGIAAVLAAGAAAAPLGTAFMLCPEAGTTQAHREMIRRGDTPTARTRAFTGRTARGIGNRFLREHSPHPPSAYPEILDLTAPLRAAARAEGDSDGFTFGQDRPARLLNQPQRRRSSCTSSLMPQKRWTVPQERIKTGNQRSR